MSARKTIQINPDFFSLGKKKKSKKEKTPKQKPAFEPNNIKKKLLAKIKEHQKVKEKEKISTKSPEIMKDDFDNSMKYVQKMIEEKKHKKTVKRRRRKQKNQENISNTNENIITNTVKVSNDPPYGCLKNGSKPTYSQYKKTLKRKNAMFEEPTIKIHTEIPKEQTIISNPEESKDDNLQTLNPVLDRKMKLEKLKDKFNEKKKKTPSKKLIKRNKTIKIFNLGKNKKTRSVGVLIKSGKTRKKIKREHDVLKNKAISDIKYYLRKHNLIKIGTSAPENILRNIYENSNLSGDIYNKNVNTLLHNFMKET
jgi:hypothetical protein